MTSSYQQETMQLYHRLQRSEDETRLYKNDMERSRQRVGELEEDVKSLVRELQLDQQKCKELDAAMVIQEAEVNHY